MNPKITRRPYPHITILPVFYENVSSELLQKLNQALSVVKPFELTIDRLEMFENKKSATLYFVPEVTRGDPQSLERIYDIMSRICPE